jgi:hypothetical protein
MGAFIRAFHHTGGGLAFLGQRLAHILPALTDEGGVVLMVRQKIEFRCVVTKQLQARYP